MNDPAWLAAARTYVGQREIKGIGSNPLILKWWQSIRAPFTDDETPWCAGFVGAMLEQVGIRSTRAASARSYCAWGVALNWMILGAVVVFERGPGHGHVGFVVGRDESTNLLVLGGNQGDSVSVATFPMSRIIALRWPVAVPIPEEFLPRFAKAGPLSSNEA
jgi:uncharacterized protein (TIGR02594 family)